MISRRERNSITTPLVKPDHQWDFKHVKHLCGQGKLYVRLNVSKEILVGSEETDEEPEKEEAASNVGPTPPIILMTRNINFSLGMFGIPIYRKYRY